MRTATGTLGRLDETGGEGEADGGSAKDDGEEEEEEERAVFDKLADMQDDLGCLKLSRELQVCLPLHGSGGGLQVERRCVNGIV